jgi:SAM-dependent methyltransferase
LALIASLKSLFSSTDLRDQPDKIRHGVRKSYSRAATDPGGRHPFPCGPAFALDLGYPKELLASLPEKAQASFVGVSPVSLFADLAEGSTILDLGCGAGLDAVIAADRVGPTGLAIGVDFSPAMLNQARQAAAEANLANLKFICADVERLPLTARSVDVVLVNGIFNLNPNRTAVFAEIGRVIRPGGWVYAAELVLTGPLPPKKLRHLDDWFS